MRELAARSLTMIGAFVPATLADPVAHAPALSLALRTARLLAACAAPDDRPFVVLADDPCSDPVRLKCAGRIQREQGLTAEQWRTLARGADSIARAVRDETGLRTVFHHHSGSFVETPSEIETLLDITAPDLIGLCLDTGHYIYGGGDALDALKRFGGRVWHVHFKDCPQPVLDRARALRRGETPDARPFVLAHLLLHSGVKKGECLAIHLNHIELRGPDGPLLYVRYPDVSKRYKERKLPLDSAWVAAFEDYRRQYEPSSRLFPWSPRRLEYLLEELGNLAGLEKHLSFDMCRWTFALRETRAGVEPDRLRQRMGLSKIQWREVGAKLEALAARTV